MSNQVDLSHLGEAISETLAIYGADINKALIQQTETSMKELVKKTKKKAPVGARKSYKKNIAADYSGLKGRSAVYGLFQAVWYVKAPDYRLTHLLANGHEKKNGGRTRPNPFLKDAVDEVVTDYEQKVEEAIRNGG